MFYQRDVRQYLQVRIIDLAVVTDAMIEC